MKKKLGDRIANSWLGMMSKHLISALELRFITYYKKFDPQIVQLLKDIYQEEPGTVLLSPHEAFMIYSIARGQKDHGGAFAEVGVFRGASAKLISEAKHSDTDLYLFDTFEGLQDVGDFDARFED